MTPFFVFKKLNLKSSPSFNPKLVALIMISKFFISFSRFSQGKIFKKLYKNNTKRLSVSVVGGVANNDYLKKCFENLEKKEAIGFIYPPKYMMNDNAAMIAWATILKYKNSHDLNFKPNPRLSI